GSLLRCQAHTEQCDRVGPAHAANRHRKPGLLNNPSPRVAEVPHPIPRTGTDPEVRRMRPRHRPTTAILARDALCSPHRGGRLEWKDDAPAIRADEAQEDRIAEALLPSRNRLAARRCAHG